VSAPPDLSVLRKAKVFCPVLSPLPDSEYVEPVRLCCFYTEYKLLDSLILLRGGVLDYSHERQSACVLPPFLKPVGGKTLVHFVLRGLDLIYLKSTRLFTCQSWSDRELVCVKSIRRSGEDMLDFSTHPLVEAAWLAAHLSDAELCIVDARWRGDGTSRELFQRGHIPGAVHLDWYHDLSWTDARGVRNLLLPPVPPEPFATVMQAAGIGDQTRVVVYAETDHSGAARI
jgi:Rhodanese-like domain